MTKEDFWNKIEINEEEKEQSIHFLKYRGIDEHNHVRQYLESLTGRRVSYSEIATAFRYDKRIRRVLYKYIGLLEESIRAYITNKYNNNANGFKHTYKTNKWLKESGNLYNALSELTFGELVSQTLILPPIDRTFIFQGYNGKREKDLEADLRAAVRLRNEVSHNRFLLDNKKLSICSFGDGNHSLWINVVNLGRLLPDIFSQSFRKEIEFCSIEKDNTLSVQVKWNLINSLIVQL